jgi:hypothetical protein
LLYACIRLLLAYYINYICSFAFIETLSNSCTKLHYTTLHYTTLHNTTLHHTTPLHTPTGLSMSQQGQQRMPERKNKVFTAVALEGFKGRQDADITSVREAVGMYA